MFNHSLNKFIKVRGYKKNKRNEYKFNKKTIHYC